MVVEEYVNATKMLMCVSVKSYTVTMEMYLLHTHVEETANHHLSELWLPVSLAVFISIATSKLEVSVKSTHHQQLLVL